jgi:hypothetical protein
MSKSIRAILIIAIGLSAQIARSAEWDIFTVVKGNDQYPVGSTLNAEDAVILEDGQHLVLQMANILFEVKDSQGSGLLKKIRDIVRLITVRSSQNLGEVTQLNIHKDDHFCYAEGTDSLEFWRSEAQRDITKLTLKKGETEKPFKKEWLANQQTISIPLAEIGEGEYKLTVTADKSEQNISDKTITFHKLQNIQGNIEQLMEKNCQRQAVATFTEEYKVTYATQP